jgi:hypothetical protein
MLLPRYVLLIQNTNREVILLYKLVKERCIWGAQSGVAKDPECLDTTLCLSVHSSSVLENK